MEGGGKVVKAKNLAENRGVPSDGLRRYGLSILKTQGKSEAQMSLKQGSNDKPRFSPYVTQWKPGLPSLSLGQSRGRGAAEKVYVLKVYVPF